MSNVIVNGIAQTDFGTACWPAAVANFKWNSARNIGPSLSLHCGCLAMPNIRSACLLSARQTAWKHKLELLKSLNVHMPLHLLPLAHSDQMLQLIPKACMPRHELGKIDDHENVMACIHDR